MNKALLFVAFVLVAVQAADNSQNGLLDEVDDLKRIIKDVMVDTMKTIDEKVAWKVHQAEERGQKSVRCAEEAGKKLKLKVSQNMGALKRMENECSMLLEDLRSQNLSAEQLTIFRNSLKKLESNASLEMTKIQADADGWAREYAMIANAC